MSCAAIEIAPAQQVGRYTICDQLAAGGMATVHLARLVGSAGFSRVVAAKRMHRHFLSDPDFKKMFLVEARLAARIQHPNVVPILDVLTHESELIIFMDYVHGESLHALLRNAHEAQESVPIYIGCAIIVGALHGLHAAHEARNEQGEPLGIVHRDVSPQNILVGADGVTRVLDFGIAKAFPERNDTSPGTLKGKFSYMAPEVINGGPVTRLTDVFSAGVVLWELLTGKKLFGGATEQERIGGIIGGAYPSPRQFNSAVSPSLESVVKKALEVEPKHRFANALEFAIAIEVSTAMAAQHVVGEWVRRIAAGTLAERAARIQKIATSHPSSPSRPSIPPIHSLAVVAKHEHTRQSILTSVATPTAKRRVTRWRRLVLGWGLAVALLAIAVWQLHSSREVPKHAPGVGSAATPTDPSSSVGAKAMIGQAAATSPAGASANGSAIASPTSPEKNTSTHVVTAPDGREAPPVGASAVPSVTSAAPKKPPTGRAAAARRARATATPHAKTYLPNEL